MSRGTGVVLAFDFGLRRIGVATGNLATRTASPVTTLRCGAEPPWQDIDRLIADWRPERLIVGVPGGDGASSIVRAIERFVAALASRYGLPLATVDESLTSHAAAAELVATRRAGHARRIGGKRGIVDRHAACLIAEQWLRTEPGA